MRLKICISLFVLLCLLFCLSKGTMHSASGQSNGSLWSTQLGTASDDDGSAIATDSQGNVIVVIGTDGSLFGGNAGDDDIGLVKYDNSGNQLWSKQIGSVNRDDVSQICVDHNNNIYLVGSTGGSLFGPHGGNDSNAFIVKYDSNGNQLWSKQFGTSDCDSSSMAIDSQNNVIVIGDTEGNLYSPNADSSPSPNSRYDYDAYIVKFDSSGNTIWSKQFGAHGNDIPSAIALDPQGNIYITGSTSYLFRSDTAHDDSFLAKFTSSGSLLWGKQFPGSYDSAAIAICVDGSGNSYIAGYVNDAPLDYPGLSSTNDTYLAKYDTNGNPIWNQTLSTGDQGLAKAVRTDLSGNILVSGSTTADLYAPNAGDNDIFLASYSPNGILVWSQQYGTGNSDEINDLCIDNQGSIYITGDTQGSLFSSNLGGDDAFIQKLSPTGQMASAKMHRPSPYKPLLFAWSGQRIALTYPSVLANKQPYVYAGYLCSGIPGAKVIRTASKQMVIAGQGKQIVITPGSLTYQINGKAHKMTAKPVMVGNECYVPLDVMKAVLPYPVRYDAKALTVHFDPPQKKVARR